MHKMKEYHQILEQEGAFISVNNNGLNRAFNGKKVKSSPYTMPQRRELTLCLLRDLSNYTEDKTIVDFSIIQVSNLIGKDKSLSKKKVTPPRWKEINGSIKADCYQKALAETGNLVPFTFNLSIALLSKARESGNVSNFLRRRIAENLKRILSRKVQFWFVIEVAHHIVKGRPHIHGALSITEQEKNTVRHKVFHKLNGVVDVGFKRHALKMSKRPDPKGKKSIGLRDHGWATYATKDISKTKLLYLDENLLTVDNATTKRAKEIYEQFRTSVIESQSHGR